jgi:hypothetical protein
LPEKADIGAAALYDNYRRSADGSNQSANDGVDGSLSGVDAPYLAVLSRK